ncbi:MAG: 30S ribosomal protein S9 [Candidatus Woesebacteria bacterium]
MAVLKKKNQAVQKIVKKISAVKPAMSNGSNAAKANGSVYIATVGRRKTAIARVRLYTGSGDNTVNDKSIASFFGDVSLHAIIFKPLDLLSKRDVVHFSIKVLGGGAHSQAEAIAHGLSRAMLKADETHKKALRDAGLLTRDPRMRETRKMGTGGKARRAKQSPKR